VEYPKEASWHWLEPDGRDAHGSLSDLRARLLTHALPPSTWVWSTTWTEWLPATRVAELVSALQPAARRPLKKPKRDPNAHSPPAQRPNDEGSRVAPPPSAAREAMSTLADDTERGPAPSNTIRPPGAVPPPPRPVPQLVKQEAPTTDKRPATPIATPIPSVFVGSQPGVETMASAPHVHEVSAKTERMSARPDTLHELGEGRSGVHSAAAAPARAEPATPAVPQGSPRALLLGLSLTCVALTIGLGFALRALSTRPAAPLAASVSSTKDAPLPSVTLGCTPLVPAAKLAASVERAVEPYFLNLGPERVAVGFAASRTEAAGLVLELSTLDQTSVFDEAGERSLLGVVPTGPEPLSFSADRDGGQLSSPRSLDVSPRTVIGFTKSGLATRVGDEAASELWRAPDLPRTEPRIARVGEKHAVLFRQGGQAGSLFVGWLDQSLQALGDLRNIEGCPSLLGTPTLAAGKAEAVAAFASRDSEQQPWRLRLARLSPEKPARVSAEFVNPAEGAGNGAIAPTLKALGNERWALQWTQGSSGQYRVFVQALASDLTPLGAPVPSSPKGASAGQGSIWVVGERALSLYVLTVGGRDELWGSVLTCR
jgi:hypothetical protein